MLETLRKGAGGFLAKTLMALLILSFALWGIGDMVRKSGETQSVATVGNESIPAAEFAAEMEKLKRSFGGNLSPELLKNLNLYSVKLSELINRSLIQQEAARVGIRISDDELLKDISNDPNFQENGKFDKTMFLKTLQHSGIREDVYLDSLRKELSARVLLSTLSIQPLVPKAVRQAVYAARHEQRRATLIAITKPEGIPDAPQDDTAVTAFYDAHKAEYIAPEYRSLHYVLISPQDILKGITLSRQELFDAYTRRTAEFTEPEQRRVDQLLYVNKEDAETAYGMLRSKKSVEETIQAVAPVGEKVTELGLKTRDAMPAGGKEVFALDKGEFTRPIHSPFGWHIFRVTEIVPEHVLPFDEVKAQLKEEMITQRANTALADTAERFEDALAAGASLKDAAKSVGLEYHSTDPVDQLGQRSDHSLAVDPEAMKELLARAFTLTEGERSELLTLPDGGSFMVEVSAITPSHERAFEEVRGQVTHDLQATQSREALKAYAETLARDLHAQGMNAESVAKRISSATQHTVTLGRTGFAGKTDKQQAAEAESLIVPAMLDELFTLKQKGHATHAYAYGGGYVIAVLEEVIPAPDPTSTAEGKKLYKALQRSLLEDYDNELLEQYLHYLHDQYRVSVNQAALNALMSEQ